MKTLLVLKTSVNADASVSNQLLDHYLEQVNARFPEVTVIKRDLDAEPVPMLTTETTPAIRAGVTDTPTQQAAVALSDTLIDELKRADAIVIGLPRYNFTVPASFKSYIDYIARPRVTFRYGENGAEGLLPNVPVAAIITSGGEYAGTDADTMSGWVTQVLGFVGLKQVQIIHAEGLAYAADTAIASAKEAINKHVHDL